MTIDELQAMVEPGWNVRIIDHDYIADSRDAVVDSVKGDGSLVLRPTKPGASQGRKFPTMEMGWDGDREVRGMTVDLFTTPPPHTGKSRRRIKSFVFSRPRAH